MATDAITTHATPSEYLAAEREATNTKAEWVDGEIREMVGGTREHSLLTANVGGVMRELLKQAPFEVHSPDLRIRIPNGPYYYADGCVAPSPPELEDDAKDTLLNPSLIVEVLSPSTESIDRGEKLEAYQRIPSLTDYLLVAQDRVRIDHYRRTAGGTWEMEILKDVGGRITLASLGVELPIAEVYDRVIVTEPESDR